jgi:hypothetical protein
MHWLTCALFIVALLAAGAAAGAERDAVGAPEALRAIEVAGAQFRVTTASGRVLPQQELVGAVLSYRQGDQVLPVRIDRVFTDPKDKSGELLLYGFSVRDAGSGGWKEMCQPDADGLQAGFPLQLGEGHGFVLTCTSGAQGKCVRFGYKPWASGPGGVTLLDHWRACGRMVRADYCGDGEPHTRDGTLIDMYDKLGIQKDEPSEGMQFEAAWSPQGAVCVRRVRIAEIFSLEALRQSCPRFKPEDLGEACSEARAMHDPEVLLMNKSVAK